MVQGCGSVGSSYGLEQEYCTEKDGNVGEVRMIQIDMQMPKNCFDCPACNEYLMCAIPIDGRGWGENDVREFGQGRPEWCPMKEQKAVKPRVSSADQRCGNCNKVIEMDGWKSCPWCGKIIDWERWWNENGTHDNS